MVCFDSRSADKPLGSHNEQPAHSTSPLPRRRVREGQTPLGKKMQRGGWISLASAQLGGAGADNLTLTSRALTHQAH